MSEALGELLFEGRSAEIFAYGEGRVIKLAKPGYEVVADYEETAFEALKGRCLPMPSFLGRTEVEGRTGLVLERIDGQTMFEIAKQSPENTVWLADQFVHLHRALAIPAVPVLPDLVERIAERISAVDLSPSIKDSLLARLKALEGGPKVVCHGDFHRGNVVQAGDGKFVVLDWVDAANGPYAADLARTLLLFGFPDWVAEGSEKFVQSIVLREIRLPDFEFQSMEDWLPIMAAARLWEGWDGEEGEWLRQVAESSITDE